MFFGRRRDALNLFFNGYKRLDRGTFQVPEPSSTSDAHVEIDDAALEALLDGIAVDATAAARPRPTH